VKGLGQTKSLSFKMSKYKPEAPASVCFPPHGDSLVGASGLYGGAGKHGKEFPCYQGAPFG